MAAGLCSFSSSMGDAFVCERGALKLEVTWLTKRGNRLGKLPCFAFFGLFGKKGIGVFEDRESSNQTIKSSFLYIFWDWVRVYMGDSVTSLLDFVDWLCST